MHWLHFKNGTTTTHETAVLWNRDISILCEMAVAVIIFGIYILTILTHFGAVYAETNAAQDKQAYEAEILQNAIIRYSIDNRKLPGNTVMPVEIHRAISICKENVFAPDVCISLDEMIPRYIAHIPVNETTNMQRHSGYAVYLNHHTPRVIAGFAPMVSTTPIVYDGCLPCSICTP